MNIKYYFPQDTRFLVTGGAGFIGSNLAEAVLNLGYRVRVIDNFSTGREENIKDFFDNPKFEFVKGDIRNQDDCLNVCKDIDYVLHQAALGSVPRSIVDPKTTNDVNITGSLNMLVAARDSYVKRFIFASSSSVYGDSLILPKIEGNEGKPLSPYAITKKVNEMYAKIFYELYDLETIGLRYFNVFGKKQNPYSVYAAVIPAFVKKLLNNEPPTINGDGRQSRDFTYVDNVIQANLKACMASKETCGEVFNIAYGGREYLIDIYNKLCQLLGTDLKPNYGPDRKGDIKHSNASIDKAVRLLDYTPQYDVNKGLSLAIEWYKHNL